MSGEESSFEPVAILGASGRFPGASTIDELWRNTLEGRVSLRRLAADELERHPLMSEQHAAPGFVPVSGGIDARFDFDPDFFGVTSGEAKRMDPQLRVLLECVWEAFELAGLVPGPHLGKTSIYAGESRTDHIVLSALGAADPSVFAMDAVGTGTAATRIAHRLDLTGEAVAIHTACSTGLVALHLAAQSLQTGQSDVAVAAAASVRPFQDTGYVYHRGMIYSESGQVRPFDADADGTVFGAGACALVLKLLDDAIEDGDPIAGVLIGSALNNDGSTKVGFTAPSLRGQLEVISEALEDAGADPRTIGFVETHGTGTRLGDPIELEALARAWRKHTDEKAFAALGAIKANIGHLDVAAGLAGVVRACRVLEEGRVPPLAGFARPNPECGLEDSPFFVPTEAGPYPGASPRRAAVSSLGIGGTNAHVILEQAPAPEPDVQLEGDQLFVLSARDEAALEAVCERLAAHLEATPDAPLSAVARTLATGRVAHPRRSYVVASDAGALIDALRTKRVRRTLACEARADVAPVLLFPGQGAQRAGMAKELHAREPVFAEHLDDVLAELEPAAREEVRQLLLEGDPSRDAERIARPELGLPALAAYQLAVARTLETWGVSPAAVIGHSFGEYVAACVAGVFGCADLLSIAVTRGRLMSRMPPGAMTAVALDEEALRARMPAELHVAGVNARGSCVVSGSVEGVEAFEAALQADGIRATRLATPHAFHSPDVDPLEAELREALGRMTLGSPSIPLASCVTGTWHDAESAAAPEYWVRQMRQPVRFADALDAAAALDGAVTLVELGPGRGLSALATAHFGRRGPVDVTPASAQRGDEHAALLRGLGALHARGVDVAWDALFGEGPGRRVPLPTYPFARRALVPDYGGPGAFTLHGAAAPKAAEPDAPVAATATTAQPEAGGDETLARVLEIVRERLGDDVEADDDFFEVGGTSLLGAQVVERISSAFGVELALATVFEGPTPRRMAEAIRDATPAAPKRPEAAEADRVRVRDPHSGEIRSIPRRHLETALARGLEQVD